MCFMLYAGTAKPIPRNEWKEGAPNLPVESLTEGNDLIRAPFCSPEFQRIGSTSGCGCDFPHLMFQNGEWPCLEDPEREAEWVDNDRSNMQALVALLRSTAEETIELYGVWAGGGDFFEKPQSREEVSLEKLLDADFHFKEWGFYKVALKG